MGLSCIRDSERKETLREHASVAIVRESGKEEGWEIVKIIDLPSTAKEIFDLVIQKG